MSFPIDSPLPIFYDRNGDVLDAGYVYIGTPNLNPITSPVSVYWDAAQTIPAPQPLRTVRGFIARNGAPADVYVTGDYSILVRDRNQQLVLSEPVSSASLLLDYSVDRSVGTIALLRALPLPSVAAGRTFSITVLEHTAGYGKGGGAFRWDSASVIADDNGRVINPTGNVGAGRWVRIDPRISVEQYGAAGDGVINDATVIQAVLTQYNAGPLMREINFDSGAYKVNSGLTVNATFVSLIGESLLDFTSTTGITGLTVTAGTSPDGGNHYGRKGKIAGLRLQGPASRATDGSIGIKFNSPVAASTPGSMLERVMVFNWDIGHQHANSSYIEGTYHSEIYRCRTCIESVPGTDAGERITYVDCTFYNSNLVLRSTKQLTFFHLVTCSLDYCNKIAEMTPGEAMLVNCHVESNGANYSTTSPIQITGDGSTFIMEGGKLLMATVPQFTAWADVGANSYCKLAPNTSFNCVTVTSGTADLAFWFTGAGRYDVRYDQSYNNSQNPRGIANGNGTMADPGMELNLVSADLRFITNDTAAITNPYTGTNVAMATSATQARTGTYSLRVTKVGGAGTAGQMFLAAVPIRANRKVGGTFWMRKPGASTGTLFFDYRFFRLEYILGIPTQVRAQIGGAFTNYVLPAGDTGWVRIGNINQTLSTVTAPQWATHVGVLLNAVSWTGGGDFLYFDDFVLDIVG